MRPICVLSLITSAALFAACQPRNQTPPSATELVGGPCQYDSHAAVAVVSDAAEDQVRFLIDGQVTPYALSDLPSFDYTPGAEFNVVEKRITQGTCTPYILEIIGPTKTTRDGPPPPPPASQTTKWKYPDPGLK